MTVRAIVMVVMVIIDMVPVIMIVPASIVVIPMWPIAPIPRRIIAVPGRSPEPVVDNRSVDINRLNDIVDTIDIFVAYHLSGYLLSSRVFLNVDRCNILEDILRKHSLDKDEVLSALSRLNNAKIINHTIAIEVEVGDMRLLIIKLKLELLEVF